MVDYYSTNFPKYFDCFKCFFCFLGEVFSLFHTFSGLSFLFLLLLKRKITKQLLQTTKCSIEKQNNISNILKWYVKSNKGE